MAAIHLTRLTKLNGRLVARVPRTDATGRQARNVLKAIRNVIGVSTPYNNGLSWQEYTIFRRAGSEALRMMFMVMPTAESFNKMYYYRDNTRYNALKKEALKLRALRDYYEERATCVKEITDLTDADWENLEMFPDPELVQEAREILRQER